MATRLRAAQSPIEVTDRGLSPTAWRRFALVALGLLVLSNLAWWSTTRPGAAAHAAHPSDAAALPAPERVIYAYGPTPVTVESPKPVERTPTPLRSGERCAGGQIIRRLPNGWEGLGRPCTP